MWPFECLPDFARKSRVVTSDVIKLSFFPKIFDGFRPNFHSICQIDAQEGAASFVSITNAVREL